MDHSTLFDIFNNLLAILPCISNHFLELLSFVDEGNEHEKLHRTHHRGDICHLGWIDDNLSTTYIFDTAIQHESLK